MTLRNTDRLERQGLEPTTAEDDKWQRAEDSITTKEMDAAIDDELSESMGMKFAVLVKHVRERLIRERLEG